MVQNKKGFVSIRALNFLDALINAQSSSIVGLGRATVDFCGGGEGREPVCGSDGEDRPNGEAR